MLRCLFLLLIIFPFSLIGQYNLFSEKDSIKFSHRTGGIIDSLDMSYSSPISTFPGGSLNTTNSIISTKFIFEKTGLQNFRNPPTTKQMIFSGIPHLGFSYSFGSKGTQFLHFDYQHTLSKKTLLNLNYQRNSSNGFLRNSKYSDNTFIVQIRKNNKFYSYYLESYYSLKNTSLNGGVSSYENIKSQGLEFLPINNSNAKNNIKIASVKLNNYFNLKNDSINAIGLVTKHEYEVLNREFTDNKSLQNWNIDSVQTRDQYRFASIRNSSGLYLKSKNSYFDFLIQQRYWDYQNLGIHHDTTEINLISSIKLSKKKLDFKNDAIVNLIGAGGEWSNKSVISTYFHKINFYGSLLLEQKWPEAFQRFYFSNNYDYKLGEFKLQNRINSSIIAKYKLSEFNSLQIGYSNSILHNNYFFIDSIWRNDTLNIISINSFSINGHVKFGSFNIQPNLTLNLPSSNFSYIPKTTINTRLFLKKKMFKAKKMEGIYGVDFAWISSYNLMSYNSLIDVFTVNDSKNVFHSMTNLSAFLGFSLGEFRFYARMENIGYFWNDKSNQILVGYPIQKNFIRLGLTWDFFN
jgi:hypothetical protein